MYIPRHLWVTLSLCSFVKWLVISQNLVFFGIKINSPTIFPAHHLNTGLWFWHQTWVGCCVMSGCVDTRDYVCNNRAATVHKNCALILWHTLMHHHKSPVFCAVRDSVYVLIQQATDNVPLESWGYNVRRSGCSYGGVTDSVPAWRFRVKLRVEQCTLLSFLLY